MHFYLLSSRESYWAVISVDDREYKNKKDIEVHRGRPRYKWGWYWLCCLRTEIDWEGNHG